jgi:hypothetical protein
MNTIVFYLAAMVFYGFGAYFIKNTNPYSRSGGDNYLRRDKRRLIGKTLLALATLFLAIGLIAAFIVSSS